MNYSTRVVIRIKKIVFFNLSRMDSLLKDNISWKYFKLKTSFVTSFPSFWGRKWNTHATMKKYLHSKTLNSKARDYFVEKYFPPPKQHLQVTT